MAEINRKAVSNNFSLPSRIHRLGELAFNLWWVWNPDAQNLFGSIDKFLWEKTSHNPVERCNIRKELPGLIRPGNGCI
jgi:hypothetical protein